METKCDKAKFRTDSNVLDFKAGRCFILRLSNNTLFLPDPRISVLWSVLLPLHLCALRHSLGSEPHPPHRAQIAPPEEAPPCLPITVTWGTRSSAMLSCLLHPKGPVLGTSWPLVVITTPVKTDHRRRRPAEAWGVRGAQHTQEQHLPGGEKSHHAASGPGPACLSSKQ